MKQSIPPVQVRIVFDCCHNMTSVLTSLAESNTMINLLIDESDVNDFVSCWKENIKKSVSIIPYNSERNALFFSFDTEMRPFLDNTKGWHSDLAKRLYLEKSPRIIRDIGRIMSPYREAGGRVFVDKTCAYFDDEFSGRTDICDLTWPKDRDVVDEIHRYWQAMRPRATITLTRVFQVGRQGSLARDL
jgi:hypothetical protein